LRKDVRWSFSSWSAFSRRPGFDRPQMFWLVSRGIREIRLAKKEEAAGNGGFSQFRSRTEPT